MESAGEAFRKKLESDPVAAAEAAAAVERLQGAVERMQDDPRVAELVAEFTRAFERSLDRVPEIPDLDDLERRRAPPHLPNIALVGPRSVEDAPPDKGQAQGSAGTTDTQDSVATTDGLLFSLMAKPDFEPGQSAASLAKQIGKSKTSVIESAAWAAILQMRESEKQARHDAGPGHRKNGRRM